MRNFNRNLTRRKERPSAMDYGLFLVSLRAQTSAQLSEKMARKKYSEEEISDVIHRLTELGYLDDEQFAQIFFDNLLKYKHFGYYGIKKKLQQKKVDSKKIDQLLKSLTLLQETEIAKRALGTKVLPKEKIVRMLQSRGFRSETIFAALKKLMV